MSGRLRILYHHRIRAEDGQAVHVRELIAALRQAGHEVLECALVPKASAAPASPQASPQAAAPPRGRFWQKLQLPRPVVELLEIAYNRRGRAMLRAAARDFAPDLLYERHALHCSAGTEVARELGIPLLLEVNSPMVAEMQTLGKLCFPARARACERAVLGGADAVLAVTAVLGELLVAAGARRERLHVIGNGAVPERYGPAAKAAAAALRATWQLPTAAFALGFVGYMRPWHRLDLVLEVMQRPGFGDLVFVAMGQGPALPGLQQRAAELGLAGRLLVLGEVPAAQLPAHVLACDGALIPAINSYASPLKLFDSLAAGVPTVAPDQPNLRENLQHGQNGLLFTPGSVDALAAALGELVGDRQHARALGAAGQQSLLQQQWTWAGNAARVARIAQTLGVVGR